MSGTVLPKGDVEGDELFDGVLRRPTCRANSALLGSANRVG
jgi:hypothetical protein